VRSPEIEWIDDGARLTFVRTWRPDPVLGLIGAAALGLVAGTVFALAVLGVVDRLGGRAAGDVVLAALAVAQLGAAVLLAPVFALAWSGVPQQVRVWVRRGQVVWRTIARARRVRLDLVEGFERLDTCVRLHLRGGGMATVPMARPDEVTTRFLGLLREQHRLARAAAVDAQVGREGIDRLVERAL
jgi:hypothetical protein